MDTSEEDRQLFDHVTCNISASVDEVTAPGALAMDLIEQVYEFSIYSHIHITFTLEYLMGLSSLTLKLLIPVTKAEVEVERLDQLKASRMQEIAFKKQAELEEIFARAHVEVDPEAAREKIMALIESGKVEPAELITDLDNQIVKAREEALSRKEILDKVEKWMSACEEESWLEDYNRVLSLSTYPQHVHA